MHFAFLGLFSLVCCYQGLLSEKTLNYMTLKTLWYGIIGHIWLIPDALNKVSIGPNIDLVDHIGVSLLLN